jgi:3-dehydroquinate synthase
MAPEFFALLENNLAKLNSFDPDFYAEIIHRSCQCKAEVVAGDEREQGRRAILNYGHTVGHAVEKLSNFALPHGRAVAIGMAAAARLAVKMQLLDPAAEVRQNQLLTALNLPVRLPENSCVKSIVEAMKSDKKNSNGKINMILPRAIGAVEIVKGIDEAVLKHSLEELL